MRLIPLLSSLILSLLPLPALAQSIIPAADGTGTLVLPDGTTYTITGGTLSRDGGNLFHSFEQFGLTANEVATFLANPSVQNILGRVVGGNASLIDGLMQVQGGANLYLINPAGILFGPNTVLNLDGSFTATSASGVGFGESWLHALEQSDYHNLTGNPTAFSFAENAGAIINSGNLTVGQGERLTLMGGSVVNLGTLEAPGGQITVLAVPGENLVILRPVGSLLGIELAPLPNGAPNLNGISPLDIPGLLRAGEPDIATGMIAHADGTVSLVGSPLRLPTTPGTAITSGNLSVAGEQGGAVQVLGDRVAVVGATIEASGTQGGGQVLIGGEYQGQGTTPTANRTFMDATSTITANAGETGDGGEVILWAEEATQFDGTITAQGGTTGGDGGFVEVSGRQTLAFNGFVDVSAPNGQMGTLLLDPTDIFIVSTFPVSGTTLEDASLPEILASDFLPDSISLLADTLQSQVANVVLQATRDIIIETGLSLNFVPGGSITFTADADGNGIGNFSMDTNQSIVAQTDSTGNGRDITISGVNVTVGTIQTAGQVTLTTGAEGFVTVNGSIQAGDIAITTDNLDFFGGANSITSPGELTIRTASPNRSISVGGIDPMATGVLFLPQVDLDALADGFSRITLGSPTGTGDIVFGGNVAFSDPTVLTTFGAINTEGFSLIGTDNASLTLEAGSILAGKIQSTNRVSLTTRSGGFVGVSGIQAGAGGITITTDDLFMTNSIADSITSPGELIIQTASPDRPILLGSVGSKLSSALYLDQMTLDALADGFRRITVGRPTGTGDMIFEGNVTFRDPTVLTTFGNINTQGFNLTGTGNASFTLLSGGGAITTRDITVPGGPITLQASGPITAGNLNTRGSVGGAVSLQSGDRIQVNTINAEGDSVGGSITATAGTTFQAFGSFLARNGVVASLSTVGGIRGGPISLTYNASRFTIGDASFNGTQAAITSGDITLLPDQVVIGSQVFGSGLPGQVSFTAPGEPSPPPPPPPPPSQDTREVILDDIEVILAVGDLTGEGDEPPVLLTNTGQMLQDGEFSDIEAEIASEFSRHFGSTFRSPRPVSLADAQNTLRDIQAQTGEVPALVYVRFNRQASQGVGRGALELLLVPPNGDPVRVQVLSANPQAVIRAQELLRRQLTNPNLTDNRDYLIPAQQLYDWIIAPIRGELEAAGITNLSFIMDAGLRTLPLAALHDGERFLLETYSVGLMPSLGLIDPTYVNLNRQSATLLLGGASQFLSQPPLLAARTELEAIQAFWPSTVLAETNFTVATLQQTRRQAQIVHLATHAEFLRGAPDQSYIQFSDGRLSLNNMAQLRWFDPPVDLVTLSACQTAMGNAQAELGFAGFALQAGARSALASLWRVSDEATAGLMTTFYQQLDQQTTKSEALRQAQLAFMRGEATIENGQIRWPGGTLPLPPALTFSGTQDLSHPFYWAAFTVVGSPW